MGRRPAGGKPEHDPNTPAGSKAPGSEPGTPPDDASAVAQPADLARVLSLGSGHASIAWRGGVLTAQLVAHLAETQQTSLAVGDLAHVDERADGPWITAVAPRRTTLCRPDPGNVHRRRVLAANIDVAVLVIPARRSRFKPGLIDRFLIALEHGGARPVVAVNKVDLLTDEVERTELLEQLTPYDDLGVPVVLTSAETGVGLEELRAVMGDGLTVFVGHSGVGKSSLLNGLDPSHGRRVHAERAGDGKGRHTTTRSTLTELPEGGAVIDTPGVRAFGLWGLEADEVRAAFPDLAEHAQGCRFRDCSHAVEPDCAVRAAVEAGELSAARLASFARILGSLSD